MANEIGDAFQGGVPEADIPDLKKKEKERKKAGAAWSGARGSAGRFTGATGGTARAAASAASMEGAGLAGAEAAAEAAALGAEGGGGIFAGIARFIAGIADSMGLGEVWAAAARFLSTMGATLAGKVVLAAAAALMMAAAGVVGYALLKGAKGGAGSMGMPDLGGISDSMRVRSGGSDRVAVNSNGELRFDSGKPPAAKAPPAATTEEKKVDDKPVGDPNKGLGDGAAGLPMATGQLAHNLSGAKLSSSLGGEFGGHNIFSGNSSAPKFGGAGGPGGMGKFQGAKKGAMGNMRPSPARGTASKQNGMGKATSNRAMGQLKAANGLSQAGASNGTNEGAASWSQGAFDQAAPKNAGSINTTGAPGGDSPGGGTSPGGGPGGTTPTLPTTPTTPTAPTPTTQTMPLQNYQSMLDQIMALAQKAQADMMMGTILCAIGVGLMCSGWWPTVILGIIIFAMGIAKIMQAMQEANMAKQMGQQLGKAMDNQQQALAVNDCTNQIISSKGGTSAQNCSTPSVNQNETTDTGQIERVKAEENATPTISE